MFRRFRFALAPCEFETLSDVCAALRIGMYAPDRDRSARSPAFGKSWSSSSSKDSRTQSGGGRSWHGKSSFSGASTYPSAPRHHCGFCSIKGHFAKDCRSKNLFLSKGENPPNRHPLFKENIERTKNRDIGTNSNTNNTSDRNGGCNNNYRPRKPGNLVAQVEETKPKDEIALAVHLERWSFDFHGPIAAASIGDARVQFLIDTGATISCMSVDLTYRAPH
ncbi:hypothetical protein BCR44DRAFT_77931 [Catenaria anguillulae PL171]|uniref:CCHC-type domain-containing protein n=1 Tax=Catenaria anguillulae PL171 TaxID=765915 RepID=A0A1Y2H5R2_9FUNG|nr:hypothetical protein BCR44DRAFT_77931 [Catenaria anguillulae PL171]